MLVKSNTPDPTEGSCSSMNVELLIRMPDHINCEFLSLIPSKIAANIFQDINFKRVLAKQIHINTLSS